MNDLILYTTESGRSEIKLRSQEQTVWRTQLEMTELFDATKPNISLYLKNGRTSSRKGSWMRIQLSRNP